MFRPALAGLDSGNVASGFCRTYSGNVASGFSRTYSCSGASGFSRTFMRTPFVNPRFIVIATCLALMSAGSISAAGRVVDAQGGVIPGAQVVARQTETNVKSETTTDGEGRFRFPYLRIGPY